MAEKKVVKNGEKSGIFRGKNKREKEWKKEEKILPKKIEDKSEIFLKKKCRKNSFFSSGREKKI